MGMRDREGVDHGRSVRHFGGMWEEEAIRFAREHHGLIDRRTAGRLGVPTYVTRHRVESARWEQIHPGVFYLNVTPPTWNTQVLAGVLAAGEEAVASHRTAALLHGLEGIFGRTIDVTVPYDDRPEPYGVILHRTRRPIDLTTVGSIPTTTVERALLDLAAMVGDRVAERLVASALRKKVTTPELIDAVIGLRGGRGVSGTRRLRRVLRTVAEDVSGSVAEVDMGALIREAPIPSPIPQLQIRLPDGSNAYPDFAWPDRFRIVEVDGLEAHATAELLSHDLNRQNQLLDLGWEIRRFPARRVRTEPQVVIAEVTRFVLARPRTAPHRSVKPARQ